MNFLKNIFQYYGFSLTLIMSTFLGALLGYLFPSQAVMLKPLGDIYLHALLSLVVPLIFFSLTTAIANTQAKILKSTFLWSGLVFGLGSFLSACMALWASHWLHLVSFSPGHLPSVPPNTVSFSEALVGFLTVSDFHLFLSKKNIIPLILFSGLLGISLSFLKEQTKDLLNILNQANLAVQKVLSLVLWMAPLGMFSYFAYLMVELGRDLMVNYAQILWVYCALVFAYLIIINTLQAYGLGKWGGVKTFWLCALEPMLTAFSTCSSSACIPVALKAAKKMGVRENIAQVVIPIGISIHKEGSVMGGVFKIAFLSSLYGFSIDHAFGLSLALLVSMLVGTIMGAIPGGGMMAEMFILSVYGLPSEALPFVVVISTLIDAPATLLNVTQNLTCALWVERLSKKEGLGNV